MTGISVAKGIKLEKPKECIKCKRDYCFMHCKFLDAYLKWQMLEDR